jgi:hypothetical protein
MSNYIYLLQEREFITTKQNIYKLGKTKQENLQRFKQYPKGSKLLLQQVCDGCDILETELINALMILSNYKVAKTYLLLLISLPFIFILQS